jgi:hypothetical protein
MTAEAASPRSLGVRFAGSAETKRWSHLRKEATPSNAWAPRFPTGFASWVR